VKGQAQDVLAEDAEKKHATTPDAPIAESEGMGVWDSTNESRQRMKFDSHFSGFDGVSDTISKVFLISLYDKL
jgi:hypothetical protein